MKRSTSPVLAVVVFLLSVLVGAMCATKVMAHQEGVRLHVLQVTEFEPTTLHRLIYITTETCLGVEGDFFGVTWAEARALFNPGDSTWVEGAYIHPRRLIILRGDLKFNGAVIAHEAIHDITGFGDPIPEEIRERCEYPLMEE